MIPILDEEPALPVPILSDCLPRLKTTCRLNPENGILPQMLAAAAMFAGGGRLPDVSDEGSRDGMAWKYSDSWELGYRTIYEVMDVCMYTYVCVCVCA